MPASARILRLVGASAVVAAAAAPGFVASNSARHPCVNSDGAALASCFGFNSTDATDTLHAAFAAEGLAHLTVDGVKGQPWLVRPLYLVNVSGLHVELAAGVTILAKQDEFHGLDDCLLRVTNVRDVVISGQPGSVLQMRRDDYAVPSRGSCPSCSAYKKAEWRMGIWLDGTATNVRLEKLHVTESGGDGLFVYGAKNTTVQDCVFDKHYRQGMSIISADGLLVERSTFADTNGTAPEAGIDIEPDRPGMQMTDVVLRDVTVRNNSGGGFMINVGNFNGSTPDISIEVTNMTVDGGSWTTGAVGIAVGNVVGVGGSISISGSRVLNTGGCGLAIYRKAARATAKLTLTDVNFTRVALGSQTKPGKSGCAPQGPCAPLMVMGGWDPPYTVDVGGFSVAGGTIEDTFDRPFLIATDPGMALVDAQFKSINVNNPHGCKSEVQKNQSGSSVAVNCNNPAPTPPPPLKTDDGSATPPPPVCTLPHGSCCGNTTWSTFKWRVKPGPNVPFSLAAATAATNDDGPLASPSTAPPPGPAQDLFTVCFTSKKLDGCTNATAANTWSGWHVYGANASFAECKAYPNIDMNPSLILMLSVSISGVPLGNMSTILMEIQPGGARAKEPSYLITATVTPIRQMEDGGSHFAPAVRVLTPNIYLVLAAENHTVQPAIITGRVANQKYYNAMPPAAAVATPRRIRILQEYDSRDDDVGAFRDAFNALVKRLGASVMKVAGGTQAAAQLAVAAGATYAGGRLTAPCNHTRCKSDHSFPNVTTEQEVDVVITNWATDWVAMMKGTGVNMSSLTQMEMYDEIGWAFPSILGTNAAGPTLLNPRVLRRFHEYIQNQSGLTEATDFGASTWSEVLPLTNLSAIELGTDPKQVQAQRILFYWSIRYTAWDTESYYAKVVAAVAKANGGQPVGAYLNCNNFHGRLYEPMGSRVTSSRDEWQRALTSAGTGRGYKKRGSHVQGSTVGSNAKGGVDWFEAGRLRTGDIIWTEDWFGDDYASEWSFLSNRMRCAARLAPPSSSPVQFGGGVVPRAGTDGRKGLTSGSSVGTPDLMMRALTLVGNGAKHIWWFAFGPEPVFPGNCYSEEAIGITGSYPGGQNTTKSALFAAMAEASRMIAGADDLLFEGEMPYSSVAILYPRSSWMWDVVNGSDHDDHDIDEDQGETEMDYQSVVYGLFRSLAQYSNRQVDFIDEELLTEEGLKPFSALIVTEPNVPAIGQAAILQWVRAGGHLATVSGAMAADRYDRPTSTLSAATGVVEAPRRREMDVSHQGHKSKEWPTLVHNATGALGPLFPYVVRSHFTKLGPRSTLLATFDLDESAAVVRTAVGQGQVTQFGFLPGSPYPFMDAYHPQPDFNQETIDGSTPYLLDFLDQAGASSCVNVTEAADKTTIVTRVETPLLVSDGGAVLTVLNWQTRTVPPAAQPPLHLHISVKVELKAKVVAVDSVALGKILAFTCTPLDADSGANDGGKSNFLVEFDIDVTYGDFVRITV